MSAGIPFDPAADVPRVETKQIVTINQTGVKLMITVMWLAEVDSTHVSDDSPFYLGKYMGRLGRGRCFARKCACNDPNRGNGQGFEKGVHHFNECQVMLDAELPAFVEVTLF